MRMSTSSCCLVVVVVVVCGRVLAQPPAVESLASPAAVGSPEDMGYAMGYRIGQQILAEQKEMGTPIDHASLAGGLADAVSGKAPRLDEAQFRKALAGLETAIRQKQQEMAARMKAAAKANLAKGTEYLKAKAGEKGVTALPSGLLYEVLKEGNGAKPMLDDVVIAHYTGTHIDGKEFDGTDPAGEPASFPLRGVVPGWQEALPLMKAGSKWRIHLPPALGYGDQGAPPTIEPNEVLVFDIELIGSQPAPRR